MSEISEVQEIIDWINEQAEAKNYPNFGHYCTIEEMRCDTDRPVLNGVFADSQGSPVARYSFTIQIDYLDTTKKIWN